jgi:hypothetical protein
MFVIVEIVAKHSVHVVAYNWNIMINTLHLDKFIFVIVNTQKFDLIWLTTT